MQLERPNWDQTRLSMAREIAKRSLCVRDQVGAVITDARNRIIGEGYNGPPAGFQHNDEPCTEWCKRVKMATTGGKHSQMIDYSDCPSLHAEANALMMSDRTQRLQGTIYVTSFPCTGCLKLISNSGLRRIHIGVDGKHEYRYQEDDYWTVRKLGFWVSFEDNRHFSEPLITAARGWIAPCAHGCDPSTTSCD